MASNKVHHRTITLTTGEKIDIKYWANLEEPRIYVAAFDARDNQVSVATYSAEVEIADDMYQMLKQSLVDSLSSTLAADLATNPGLHYRPKIP